MPEEVLISAADKLDKINDSMNDREHKVLIDLRVDRRGHEALRHD